MIVNGWLTVFGMQWIDPETGIGACLLVEQFPFADPVVIELYNDLERVVYGELVPEWKKAKSG